MAGKTIHEEPKQEISLTLTPEAITRLRLMADALDIRKGSKPNISALIEKWARGDLPYQFDLDQSRTGKLLAI